MVSGIKGHDRNVIKTKVLKKLHSEQPCSKLSSVRRNLFGVYDDKKISSRNDLLLEEEFADKLRKASQEWNFDFLNGVPLPGKYVWQQVPHHGVPSWYASTMSRRASFKDVHRRVQEDPDTVVDENNCLPQNETEIQLTHVEGTKEKSCEQLSCKKPRLIQTTIKDFTRVQKKRQSRKLRTSKRVQHLHACYSYKLRSNHHHHHLSLHARGIVIPC